MTIPHDLHWNAGMEWDTWQSRLENMLKCWRLLIPKIQRSFHPMNQNYDITGAGEKLIWSIIETAYQLIYGLFDSASAGSDMWTTEKRLPAVACHSRCKVYLILVHFHMTYNIQWSFVNITHVDHPRCWKATIDNEEGIPEEMVLSFQGVITQKDLPPIREP